MKYIAKYLSLGLLLSTAGIFGSCCPTTSTAGGCAPIRTTWVPITVGQNLYTQYHKLLFPEGFEEYEAFDDCSACSWASDFSITYRYIQSRNAATIAQSLWGSNELMFQGGDVVDRNNSGLIAEYFGMGPDTDGLIQLCPSLKNQVIDFQLAISGAKFWAQINLPVTYAKWTLTPGCASPSMKGNYGTGDLDGASIALNYAQGGATTIAGTTMVPVANKLFYDGTGAGKTKTDSFVAALNEAGLVNVDTENNDVGTYNVTSTLGAVPSTADQKIGAVNMGLYGAFDDGGVASMNGATSATFSTATVNSAPDPLTALGGYTFGMVENRNYNLFNFNPCGKWQLADIPIMIGYDFCKSDATHLGVYLKFVIPTGTKIDQCLLKYVLTPVIGNGHHFEFGVGLSGHANLWVCDTSSFGVYGDGYIDRMFGTCQTRTFDLKGQPMSRYALLYPLTGDQATGYANSNTMVAAGDINLYQGDVTATRGELMLDFIWACKNWEVGLGYAFSGQTAESMSCNSCVASSESSAYALVGNALQQTIGVGPVSTDSWETATFDVSGYDNATTFPKSNFFYLGSTDSAAQVASGENAAYSYGDSAVLDDAAILLSNNNLQGNCSGLMSGQVLNRIFGHIDYVWRDCAWQPEIGIVGSYGFVPQGKPTANYWDLGARIGFAF